MCDHNDMPSILTDPTYQIDCAVMAGSNLAQANKCLAALLVEIRLRRLLVLQGVIQAGVGPRLAEQNL